MAEVHDRIVANLALGSPLLTESASLLVQTATIAAGASGGGAIGGAGAGGGLGLADQVSQHAQVASLAAPDLALAAPNAAVAGRQ